MAVVDATCTDYKLYRDEIITADVTYTGVDPEGETRECPHCSELVRIDPENDEVIHIDDEE